MTIPKNYRQMKPKETPRKGDYYVSKSNPNHVVKMTGDSDHTVAHWTYLNFFRRRHTKAVNVPAPVANHVKNEADPKKRSNVTVVSFSYPNSQTRVLYARTVQLISLDDKYLVGLEISAKEFGDYKFQFKRYSRWKIRGISLVHFGAPLQ